MGGRTGLAHPSGRRQDGLNSLAFVAALMALFNPPEWIEALHPQLILLRVGINNKRGLPDPEAVEGYSLLPTDRNGWIHLTTDEERLWVEAAR